MAIKAAVVGGAGNWGQHYLNAYVEHPQCSLIGFVDPAAQRRDELAGYYGIDGGFCYEQLEQLLNDAVPDMVSISVPTANNTAIVIACIEAGVRVVSCEKPAAITLAEMDRIIAACQGTGAIVGVGSLIANHVLGQTGAWIAAGHIGAIRAVSIGGGVGAHVSGDGAQRLCPLPILTGLELAWAEGWELEDPYSGRVPEASAAEADGPVRGRLGLTQNVEVEIPATEPGKGGQIVVEGEQGRVAWGPQMVQLLKGEEHQDVTSQIIQRPAPQLRYSFMPLVDCLVNAYQEGVRPRPNPEDMRFALEAAIGLKQSHHRGHAKVDLPLNDRSAKIWPHPYRAFGGDVAGFSSLYPKYQAPSLENHKMNEYIK